jgi:DNA-binding response OmpR family regulator
VAPAPRVLIVEDEMLVRMAAVELLEEHGFAVVQAGSAREAMDKFNGGGRGFAAAIIDIGLPDRPGDQIAAEMRAAQGDLALLVASGSSDEELQARFAGDRRVALVGKPYAGAMLIEALSGLGVKVR